MPVTTQIKTKRIASLDLLKGSVMVIMALDHVRVYFHDAAFFFDPTDPQHTNTALFFTRWITHFCALVFSFLVGMSAYLVGRRRSKSALSSFLLTRGIWLIFVELIVVNFAWYFNIHFDTIILQVIWALGISMIFLAALVHLPLQYILIVSGIMILGHNLLDGVDTKQQNILWSVLHEFGLFTIANSKALLVAYPLIPWIGVMSLGYYFGSFYDPSMEARKRQKLLTVIGISTIMGFIIFRLINQYSNLNHWESYAVLSKTLFSFLNPSKYPPSLTFILMTLGPAILFLGHFEKLKGKVVDFLSVFGKVPFFYYIIHLYAIHFLALLLAQWTGFGWQSMILKGWVTESPVLKGYGLHLWLVYVIWALLNFLLYPVCKKFARYKLVHKDKRWLSYF